jgi:predicted nucleic acid-binding protein
MKKVIVDANILFSALLNTNGIISNLLLTSRNYFEFYATESLQQEIEKHKGKIVEITGLSHLSIDGLIEKLSSRVTFIEEAVIPFEIWKTSAALVRDVDPDDIAYIALNIYLDGIIWTGDQNLRKGLQSKGFFQCISTSELSDLREELRSSSS